MMAAEVLMWRVELAVVFVGARVVAIERNSC
jgi:hypothetical protein